MESSLRLSIEKLKFPFFLLILIWIVEIYEHFRNVDFSDGEYVHCNHKYVGMTHIGHQSHHIWIWPTHLRFGIGCGIHLKFHVYSMISHLNEVLNAV